MTQGILVFIALQTLAVIAAALYANHWFIKFVVIGYLTVLANAVYFSLDGVKGWPAEEPREIKGILASVVIVNPSSEDTGGIYIGLYPTMPAEWYEYVYPREAPKTFYLEYSNDRAATFEQAKKAMENGQEVRINGIPPKQGTGEGEPGNGDQQEEGVLQTLQNIVKRMISKQKDTYKPNVPDVEILAPTVPPQKGTTK